LDQFVNYLDQNMNELHLTPAEVAPLVAARSEFNDAVSNNDATQAQARATRLTKDHVRAHAEQLVRPMAGRLQAMPGMTDAQRERLGITVRSTARAPVGKPTTRPVATVDTTHRLQHTIAFVDELTPTSRAKPDGVSGCEIWIKIDGPPPVDPNELRYLSTDTRSPYVAQFDGVDGGKTAYYMLRWVNTRGEQGPWSQTVGATITH
jgi:hypothetical protein